MGHVQSTDEHFIKNLSSALKVLTPALQNRSLALERLRLLSKILKQSLYATCGLCILAFLYIVQRGAVYRGVQHVLKKPYFHIAHTHVKCPFLFFSPHTQEMTPDKVKKLQQELESLEGLMEEAENCVGRQKEQLKHLQVKGRPALWVIKQRHFDKKECICKNLSRVLFTFSN